MKNGIKNLTKSKIYLVRIDSYYKIGVTSTTVEARISGLQTSNPNKIEIVYAIGNLTKQQSYEYELKLHTLFAHCRKNGEWFSLSEKEVNNCIKYMTFLEPKNSLKEPEEKVIQIPENTYIPKVQLEKVNTEEEDNYFERLGQLTNIALKTIKGSELHIYLYIASKALLQKDVTTDLIPYSEIAKETGISKRTVERTVPTLIEKRLIAKIATNSYRDAGKLPYKYQLLIYPTVEQLTNHLKEL